MNLSIPYNKRSLMFILACGISSSCLAFESGSTGEDGALNPIVDTTIQLPENGVLNYTSINVPLDVTLSFAKNITNTPVTLLVSGGVTIAGIITVSGGHSTATGAAGDGNLGDDGIPGIAGPGGFDGGQGGGINAIGGTGLGPGGGNPGDHICERGSSNSDYHNNGTGGGGAGFAAIGSKANSRSNCIYFKFQGR